MALDYTQKVIELFRNPKNVGEIDSPDVEVKEGSPACGDLLQLQLKINPISKIIDDIKFKSFGCASNIATASIVTEMAKGKKIDDAEKISWQDATKELGGLPNVKVHCSVLAVDALKQAIEKYKIKEGLLKIDENAITKDFIISKLGHVIDPSKGTDIVRLKYVLYVGVEKSKEDEKAVDILIQLSHPQDVDYEENIKEEILEKLEYIPKIKNIKIEFLTHSIN
ncbi:MAG TPA: iron-sulfur cluster assembly scaffold protein [Candidatus Woesearchaeota archaeon]|nr:iron-sulfur cluster assembly scaffold protein [Candidatus Woesearchaeota archaeon]